MSDFLERLAARTIGLERGIEPVVASIFAPPWDNRRESGISMLAFERDDLLLPERGRRMDDDGRKLAGDGRKLTVMPKSLPPAGQQRMAQAEGESLPNRMPLIEAAEMVSLRDDVARIAEEPAEPTPGQKLPVVRQASVREGLKAARAAGAKPLTIDKAHPLERVATVGSPDRTIAQMDGSRVPMDHRSKDLMDESRGYDIEPERSESRLDRASIEVRSIEGPVAGGNGLRQGSLPGPLREDDWMAPRELREHVRDSASDDPVASPRDKASYQAIEADEYPGGRDEGRGLVREDTGKLITGPKVGREGSEGIIDRSSRRPSDVKGEILRIAGCSSIAKCEIERRPLSQPLSEEKTEGMRIAKGGIERLILPKSRSSMRRIGLPVPSRLEDGPEISVRIGRVEVIAVPPAGPDERTQSKEKRQPKIFSLDEYLDRRRKGEI